MRGTVKWFDSNIGYGFIKSENGADVFVHWTGIINMEGFKYLKEGQTVEFNVIETEKGKQAVDVNVIANGIPETIVENVKEDDSKMSKNFKENFVETVGEVTKYAKDYISERYDEACDNLKNLTEDNKKMLKSCNIEIDDTTDLPSVLTSIKEQWNDYGCIQKAMISEMIAGVRGVDTLKSYLDA